MTIVLAGAVLFGLLAVAGQLRRMADAQEKTLDLQEKHAVDTGRAMDEQSRVMADVAAAQHTQAAALKRVYGGGSDERQA